MGTKNTDLRFINLFKSYVADSCNDEERKEFLRLTVMPKHKDLLLELIEKELDAQPNGFEIPLSQADTVWERITLEAKARENEKSPLTRNVRVRRIWWTAAATLLLPVLLLTFFFVNESHVEQLAAHGPANSTRIDIRPGGNKATLILADHSSIQLDTAKTGILVKQGNVNVSKVGEGALAYNAVTNQRAAAQYNTIVTPRGGQFQLRLPDGSNVWLNAASSIKFPTNFTDKKRIVEITGEVYFEVEHNAHKPFLVRTGRGEIEVLGTKFNVNAYDEKLTCTTTLLEGSLRLKAVTKMESRILRPGQQASVNTEGGISLVENVDVGSVIAWKSGYFQFRDTALESVMQQISRWYDFEVVYGGKQKDIRLTGIISRSVNASSVFKMLEISGVNFSVQDHVVVVN